MRKIRFRGKTKYGVWVYGGFVKLNDTAYIVKVERQTFEPYSEIATMEEVDPKTVGQYTGLKDRDGQDIYEGDILIDEENGLNVVRWGDGQYLLEVLLDDGDYYTEWLSEYNEMCRVIGNVYENPELLKGEETE